VRIGTYEVLGELGRGGMGVVYKARAADGRWVAMKVVLKTSREALARFERERRLLDTFTEAEGFVPVLEAGTEKGAPYFVMPLLGGTLREKLREGALPVDETVTLGRALAAAIGIAHGRGIVHRDLKPENVLFTAEGRPLVADLGLAKHFDHFAPGASQSVSLSSVGEFRGTAGYMSPEQMRNTKSAGPPADVFALGAILHECLTGQPVFVAPSLVEVIEKVTRDPVPPIPRSDVPREVEAAILKALTRDPAGRFQDGAALARALDGLKAAETRSRRSLALAIAGGVALTGMAAGLLVFASPGGPVTPPVVSVPVAPPEPPPSSPRPPEAPPVTPVEPEVPAPPVAPPAPRRPPAVPAATSGLLVFRQQAGPPAFDPVIHLGKSDFLVALGAPDSTRAAAAIRGLDPDSKEGHSLLMFVLEKGSWYLRAIAEDKLARTTEPALLDDLASSLSARSSLVREGAIAALSRANATNRLDLGKAIADRDWHVRREVAYALRNSADKATVDALIARWQVETNPLVQNTIRRSLEDVTKYYLGPDPKGWASWWLKARDTIDLAAPDEAEIKKQREAAKRAEEDGLKSTSGGLTEDRGTGVPIFVLPELGYSKEMMIPFLLEIEKLGARLKFVDPPPTTGFRNLTAGPGGIPYFPLDKLVDALEEDRKNEARRGAAASRVAFIACGKSSWVATRYAAKYPAHVAGIVLVSPSSSTEKAREAVTRLEERARASNSTELLHLGLSLVLDPEQRLTDHERFHRENKVPLPEGEAQALDRIEFTTRFADQQDGLLEELYPIHGRDLGPCLVPEYDVMSENTVDVPVLVVGGSRSMTTSDADVEAVAHHYSGELVTFDDCADFPFAEQPEKFNKVLTGFLVTNFAKRR
jgi:tRNA A-37 threonylcarbamoyl transferase component Bud32